MAGLLNTLKKNWRGLLDEVQAAPESLRALTQPAAAQQFDAALRKGGTIDKEKAVQMAMDVLQTTPMGVMGKIVYHGSPHKFDKFDMSKIGTGEGAQAYGHGLYMAESPDVAKGYKERLSGSNQTLFDLNGKTVGYIGDAKRDLMNVAKQNGYSPESAALLAHELQSAKGNLEEVAAKFGWLDNPKPIDEEVANLARAIQYLPEGGALYKVDIPDESIPRMLDWDKPLSQQAPEVQKALQQAAQLRSRQTGGAFGELDMNQLGRDLVPTMGEGRLKQSGIPGIRYLDGGSRTAGEGTSNFVLFDDQLPRILERNGIPTGLNPWAPGEWRGLLEP